MNSLSLKIALVILPLSAALYVTLETAERGRKEAQDRVAGLNAQADALRCLLSDERAARLDLSILAAEEAAKADAMRALLTDARLYVTDALEAHEHSDGRDLLHLIDAALGDAPQAAKTGRAPRGAPDAELGPGMNPPENPQ